MFFTRVALVMATLAFIIGVTRVALGFAIATEVIGPYEAALARFTTASSSGEVIDKGLLYIVGALALGTLAEIGFWVRKGAGNRD